MSAATTRVSVLDAREVVADAGRLLRAVWAPPTIHYTDAFLAWQFNFPGGIRPLAAAARDADGALVGFAAVTPRRMRLGEWIGTVAALSYVAVAPEQRGRGIAAAVYAALLDAVASTGAPVLTFGQPGTGGERALLAAYRDAGYRAHLMGPCSAYAGVVASDSPGRGDADDASSVVFDAGAPDVLWAEPDAAEIAHYLADPRPRHALSVDGVRRSGMAVAAEMLTARGQETAVLLEQVRCGEAPAEELRALAHGASALGTAARVVVTIPNLAGVDADAARAAGFRRMATSFNAYWCTRADAHEMHALAPPSATNSEII